MVMRVRKSPDEATKIGAEKINMKKEKVMKIIQEDFPLKRTKRSL